MRICVDKETTIAHDNNQWEICVGISWENLLSIGTQINNNLKRNKRLLSSQNDRKLVSMSKVQLSQHHITPSDISPVAFGALHVLSYYIVLH